MKKAFVLGAGFGTRLRPLTHVLPKPLIPVVNKPLIHYAFDQLIRAGTQQFIVNTHHLHGCYADAFPGRNYLGYPLHLVHEEPEILDTGGGIANIASLVKDDSFWVFNGDILTDLPLEKALAAHQSSGNLATLILRSTGPNCNVAWDAASGRVRDLRNSLGTNAARLFQFAGIYLVHPGLLRFLQPGRQSIVPAFLRAITDLDRLGGVLIDEGRWWDLGDRQTYLEACLALVTTPGHFQVPARLHPAAEIAGSAEVDGCSVVGERCVVGDGVRLIQSVLWAGAQVEAGSVVDRCVLTGKHPPVSGSHRDQDMADFLDPARILELTCRHLPQIESIPFKVEEIHQGGSDRRYFRLTPDIHSFIFSQYTAENPDNSRFAQHTDYLASHGVPVPRIWARDPENHRLWIEDLGSRDLWSYREDDWHVIRRPLYEASISAVARIHAIRKDDPVREDRPPLGPEFDEALYFWEQDYFFTRFVTPFSAASPEVTASVREDPSLSALREELAALPRCLIHRDFQSQNIIVNDGRPVFIDYQGLRYGLGEYDLASLIYDPYVPMTPAQREELIRFAEPLYPGPDFRRVLLCCACQRLMQALGAYGFLGLVKQKRSFLIHIRPAVQNLQEVAVASGLLPALAPVLSLRDFEL